MRVYFVGRFRRLYTYQVLICTCDGPLRKIHERYVSAGKVGRKAARQMAGTPLPALAGMNKRWSERKQAVWITWMVENDATPGQAYREQQGQPKKDIVSKSTLRRWLNHFKW